MKYLILITCLVIFSSCKDEQSTRTQENQSIDQKVVKNDLSKNDKATEDCSDKPCCQRGDCEITAPNGGALMKLGGDAAVLEMVIDHNAGEISVYMYDGLAKEQLKLEQKDIRLSIDAAQKLNIILKADEKGVFRAKSTIIKGLKKFQGTISELEVEGLPFDGTVVYYPEGN
jgi:hypothetical protein